MAKTDHPALLGPGLHALTELDFFQLTVSAFPGSPRRAILYGLFATWAGKMRTLGLTGTLWLDGSFLTSKSEPDDIDVVLWSPMQSQVLSSSQQTDVAGLLDKGAAKFLYGLDLYIEMPNVLTIVQRQTYWTSVFGRCHDGVTSKGIAEVPL